MPKEPLPLTIVTAVLNEEENLPEFLKYVKKLAQEVIVITDYRTTDNSIEIAKKSGVEVIVGKGESKGIVFFNKNRGIDAATQKWILILDADERLDEIFEKELEDIVTGKYESKATMFQTGFINFEFGKYFTESDQKEKKFIRLFKKGAFRYNTEKTAEGFNIQSNALEKATKTSLLLKIPILRSYILKQNPKIENLKGFIIHNSHPTINDFIRKINLYSSREAKILYNINPHPSMLFLMIKLFLNPLK
jgi:glycosyltransferase involved in cell wall biosynthesis